MKKILLMASGSTCLLSLLYASAVVQPSPAAAQQQQQQQRDELDSAVSPEKFWKFLQEAKYRDWKPWPGHDGDFFEGQEPHGALLKVYVNRATARNQKNPPDKSIIVKENYTPDKKLAAITVMHRVKGFDAEHGNWWWVKYNPDGTVDEQNGKKLAGKVQGCIRCHSAAAGNDFVYMNDERRK